VVTLERIRKQFKKKVVAVTYFNVTCSHFTEIAEGGNAK